MLMIRDGILFPKRWAAQSSWHLSYLIVLLIINANIVPSDPMLFSILYLYVRAVSPASALCRLGEEMPPQEHPAFETQQRSYCFCCTTTYSSMMCPCRSRTYDTYICVQPTSLFFFFFFFFFYYYTRLSQEKKKRERSFPRIFRCHDKHLFFVLSLHCTGIYMYIHTYLTIVATHLSPKREYSPINKRVKRRVWGVFFLFLLVVPINLYLVLRKYFLRCVRVWHGLRGHPINSKRVRTELNFGAGWGTWGRAPPASARLRSAPRQQEGD